MNKLSTYLVAMGLVSVVVSLLPSGLGSVILISAGRFSGHRSLVATRRANDYSGQRHPISAPAAASINNDTRVHATRNRVSSRCRPAAARKKGSGICA